MNTETESAWLDFKCSIAKDDTISTKNWIAIIKFVEKILDAEGE